MPDNDFNLTDEVEKAYAKLPMDAVFERYGLGAYCAKDQQRKLNCPKCNRLGTFGPFYMRDKHRWTFNCFGAGCEFNKDTRPKGFGDEVGFVGIMEGCHQRIDAVWKYLAMVGVEKPERTKKARPARPAPPREESSSSASPTEEPPPPTDADYVEPPPEGEESSSSSASPEDPAPAEEAPPPDDGKIVPFKGAGSPAAPPKPPPRRGSNFGGGNHQEIWERFHSMLTLTAEDRAKLKRERGFTDEVIDLLRLRSNNPSNLPALQALREKYPLRDLLECGLFRIAPNGKPEPERQFCGWGMTKKKNAKGEEIEEWGQANRPLIPYLNKQGLITFMRPHKGNISKLDKDDDETCGGHIYCPFLLQKLIKESGGRILITESEFKAAAVFAVGIPAIGIPGTSFVRNPIFRQELIDILNEFGVGEVAIVFDNENKSIPGIPGYKSDPWNRYDTAVWMKYMAWDLTVKTPHPPALSSVRLGWLPDEWRLDEQGKDTGKIDWDTALANFVRRAPSVRAGYDTARAAFEKVLDDATDSKGFSERFTPEAARIIEKKLGDKWFDPKLKSGGDKEKRIARRLDKIGSSSSMDIVFAARRLSRAFKEVIGKYYDRKPPSEKRARVLEKQLNGIKEKYEEMNARRDAESDREVVRLKLEMLVFRELLEGEPEDLSNFTVKCEYCRHTVDGVTERMVRFTNSLGRSTELISLPGEMIAGLHDFRVFCNERTQGIASWYGGEKHLQALQTDMVHFSAYRDIFQVESYGYHPKTGLWFFGDCAFSRTGQKIEPDDHNVFWLDGVGYQIDASSDDLGTGFSQSAPLLNRRDHSSIPVPDTEEELAPLPWLWSNFQEEIYKTIGGFDGMFMLGLIASYAAGPEIFEAHRAEPGLWIYGKRASGKTTIARWNMQIYGFMEGNGIRIDKGTTHVGMARGLSQYSFLPFWFDEYRKDIDVQKESVVRGAYDRSHALKGVADGSTMTKSVRAKTIPMITGESSSNDSATRSRFGHILVSASRRSKDNEKWRLTFLEKLSRHLPAVGRFLMENRPKFAERSLQILDRWLEDPAVCESINDVRTRLVHGTGFACFVTLNEMLGLWKDVDAAWVSEDKCSTMKKGTIIGDFGHAMITHSAMAFSDVQEETMANKIWQGLGSAIKQKDVIPKSFFLIRDCRVDADSGRLVEVRDHELPTAQHRGEVRRVMFMAAKEAYDCFAAFHRRVEGEQLPLSYNDVYRESKREPWWINPPANERVHRIYIEKTRHSCWAIDLSQFPYAQDFEDALSEPEDHPSFNSR